MSRPDNKALFTVTSAALKQVHALLDKREKSSLGIRVGVRSRGCSGLSYTLEFCDEINPADEVVNVEDLKIFIDPKAVMFVVGTEMDFVEEKMQSGFVFQNPNEKGRCGCGESFHV